MDVLIVGAGVAGLTTALKLKKKCKHMSIVVVEASWLIGGRVRRGTFRKSNVSFDEGAGYFSLNSPVYEYLKTKLGEELRVQLTEYENGNVLYFRKGLMCSLADNEAYENFERLEEKLLDLKEYEIKALGLKTLEDWYHHNDASEEVLALAEADSGTEQSYPIREIGLLAYWRHRSSLKDMWETFLPQNVNGTAVLIDELVKELRESEVEILLKWRARSIEKFDQKNGDDHILIVHPENGDPIEASHVVITASIGVLQAGIIEFKPKLPEETAQAISKMKIGNFVKISVLLNKMLEKEVVSVDTGFAKWFWNTGTETPNVIATLFEPPLDKTWTPKGLVKAIETQLQSIFGPEVQVLEWSVDDWSADENTLGTYSVPTVDEGNARMVLRRPLWKDSLYFAGEATVDQFACVMGAWMSATRVSNKILKRTGNASSIEKVESNRRPFGLL